MLFFLELKNFDRVKIACDYGVVRGKANRPEAGIDSLFGRFTILSESKLSHIKAVIRLKLLTLSTSSEDQNLLRVDLDHSGRASRDDR